MDKIFLPLYHYFRRHKALMYTLMILSSVIFIFFGLKVEYEEDISKLLPSSGSEESGLAFGNLQVKDKIFIQITSRDSLLSYSTLAEYADEFAEGLIERDSSGHYIGDILYKIEDDLPVMALGFAMDHVPSFIDTSLYSAFDSALEPANIDSAMARNAVRLAEDETGSLTQMVATDPLELRNILRDQVFGNSGGSVAGFAMVDGYLFCPDSTVALAFVSPNFKSLDSKSGIALAEEIESEIEEFELSHPDAEVLFHGAPVRSVGNSRTIKKDLLMTVGLSLILILVVLMICFRSLDIIWQNLLPVAYGAFFSLTCMYLIKGGMSLMALGIGAIVLGVALSYCLHVIIHQKFVGTSEQMLREESTPVCLGCVTTMGAFLGLLFTTSDLLRDFGLFATFALIGNTFFALVFLPHFLKDGDTKINPKAFNIIRKINNYPYDAKPVLIAAVSILIAVGIAFSGKVTFDSDLRNIGYETEALKKSEKLYSEKNDGGHIRRYYAAAADSLDAALAASGKIADKLDSLKEIGLVKQSSSLISSLFVPIKEQNERIAAWEEYWSEDKMASVRSSVSAAAKKYSVPVGMFEPFYAMAEGEYCAESLYDAGIIPEALSSNFIEKMPDGKYMVLSSVQIDQPDKQTVDDEIAVLPGAVVVDPFYYTNDMVKLIHEDFNVVLWISSLFVLVVLLLAFRNLFTALLAFMPMFFSWYVVQGLMAIFGLQFNLINIVISTFIFGIGVDYSIFVMEGLLDKARKGVSDMLEYHKVAIFFSAFVLFVVVFSLLFASHPAIYSIGLSTVIGMASTILITYTLQPFLFRLMMKSRFLRKSMGIKD